jgi:hypothetical protein
MDNKLIRKKLQFDLHRQELLKLMSQFTLKPGFYKEFRQY